jgi:hypothetical protein
LDGLATWTATGVGSLPGTDAQAAVRGILRELPELPYWPQLPALGLEESALWQFLPRLPGLPPQEPWEGKTGRPQGDLLAWLRGELSGLETPMDSSAGLAAFEALAREPRWVKGQVTGPVTLGLSLRDREGRPLLDRPGLVELVAERLADAGKRQGQRLRRSGAKALVVIDEPALFRLETDAPGAEAALKGLVEELKREGLAVGIHTCGPPCWRRLTSLGADVLNADVARYPPAEVDVRPMEAFLEAGGSIAWGLVPAVRDCPPAKALSASAAGFLERFEPDLLRRSLLTPSCGLAGLDEASALAVGRALRETSERLRRAWRRISESTARAKGPSAGSDGRTFH